MRDGHMAQSEPYIQKKFKKNDKKEKKKKKESQKEEKERCA